ncbi:hypothetical protein F9Y90_02495 [Borrelia miyamotoi]|uniref:LptF/LptG family permease n=1 Tax=Borrelia miyamotoi TaxID=47466 RepID=A0AAX3JMH2_9SPIR|nr:hypothetical protein [Borrelia miyamotoi]QFP41975.1 hypothetical protein F9Y90_02495 [Borrelia miyamotoi]QFP48092.1 hypothetical protein F9Y91_02490 [Borrelia miyamotoi]QGT55852.1 hypothetical protein GNY89_02500 [Borrelia miyamotoi]QGT56631.1 hypothetical protein GNY88_02500 [Borrelia miyamotoi]WAZ71889.1 hypothetical protein O5404_02525 [Borrelia miyamotoi]
MLSILRFVFLISCRFIFMFFVFSLIFICASYLKYGFSHLDLSIVSFKLYYDAYRYAFPFSLVFTFMRIAYPFNVESFKVSKSLYIVVFIFILLLSYFGFLALSNFNSVFVNSYSRGKSTIKDGVVYFFDDKIIFYSDDVKLFGFKGVLKVEDNELHGEHLKAFSYNPDFSQSDTISFKENAFLTQKSYNNLMSSILNDLDTLSNFLLSLETFSLIFNIFGFSLLLFSFSYTFNFIFSSCFSLFLYPIFVIFFFKVYNIYTIEFPKNVNLIIGENAFSNYVPFIFCLLTFFSTYLVGFISEYIRVGGKFSNSLH